MSKIAVFFGTGYEEIEALTVVDILRRAKETVEMVSITDEKRSQVPTILQWKWIRLLEKLILTVWMYWCFRAVCRARKIWKPVRN